MRFIVFVMAIFAGFWFSIISCSPTVVEPQQIPEPDPYVIAPTVTITAKPNR